jgi:hypothetical protein
MYNTNGFRTEVMKDYYITMESMFLVVKLYFHPSIGYANLAVPIINYTSISPKLFTAKAFPKP